MKINYPHLIYGVNAEEYEQVKEDIEPSLFKVRYNPERKAIGIFLVEGNNDRLILYENDEVLNRDDVRSTFTRIKNRLEIRLDELRIEGEGWTDRLG